MRLQEFATALGIGIWEIVSGSVASGAAATIEVSPIDPDATILWLDLAVRGAAGAGTVLVEVADLAQAAPYTIPVEDAAGMWGTGRGNARSPIEFLITNGDANEITYYLNFGVFTPHEWMQLREAL